MARVARMARMARMLSVRSRTLAINETYHQAPRSLFQALRRRNVTAPGNLVHKNKARPTTHFVSVLEFQKIKQKSGNARS